MKRKVSFLLACVLVLATVTFGGCTSEKTSETADNKLKIWASFNPVASVHVTNFADTEYAKELQKRLNIEVEYIHPPQGQEEQNLNVMLAGGELPDIIEHTWMRFPGGPQKAINDQYIIELTDVIEKHSPNLKALLENNPDLQRMVKTDDGKYYIYPFIRDDEELLVFMGPMVRKDWLDKFGLEEPTTIDEWTEVLRKFKTIDGVKYPLTYWNEIDTPSIRSGIYGAFGVSKSFYLDDNGEVKFGYVQPEYKEYLKTMNMWYKEGLVDPDISINTNQNVMTKMLTGESGMCLTMLSGIGNCLDAMKDKNPEFDLVPLRYPTLEKGDMAFTGHRDYVCSPNYSAAITTQCNNVETAAKWLDYLYSEEGHVLANFGLEGVTYNKDGDKYVYTDLIMNNPDGLTPQQSLGMYGRGHYGGPLVQDVQYVMQFSRTSRQKEALEIWPQTEAEKHMMPLTTPNADESAEYATIMNDINVYISEMIYKFINGQESLDNFDAYVKNIKNMGLDRALEIEKAALERYRNR